METENVTGTGSRDLIVGDASANSIRGGGGNDFLGGLGGADVLLGGDGIDNLFGGSGNDKLAGGAGQDRLTGGAGTDEFVFAAGEGSLLQATADRINDFEDGVDKITITGGLGLGDLFGFADGAGDFYIFDNVNNQYVAVITGGASMSFDASDFNFSSDPIVLDLDGDGIELNSAENGVAFDLNDDGTAETTGWAGPGDGVLVMDHDGSGAIENGSEVFSEVFDGGSYADSLEALASLDSNGDGVIDNGDEAFEDIAIWQDANSDGITQDGEVRTLSEYGIKSIDLNAAPVHQTINGNTVYAAGTYTKTDGSTGTYAGAGFAVSSDDTSDREDTTRQSTAIAAGVALVVYSASATEIAAGLTGVLVTKAPGHGDIAVSEDYTVTFTPADGFEGKDAVEFTLLFSDGFEVARSVELDVLVQEEPAASETAEVGGSSTETETEVDDTAAVPETSGSEAAVVMTGSVIRGDDGNNILVGTDGDDVLIGGLGADTLTGGEGADTFVLSSLAEADLITDYTFGEGDTIDLGELLDGAFGPGADVEEFVRAQKQAGGEVTLEVDRDGSAAAHDWQEAATLQDHASMGDAIRVVLDSEGSEAQLPVSVA